MQYTLLNLYFESLLLKLSYQPEILPNTLLKFWLGNRAIEHVNAFEMLGQNHGTNYSNEHGYRNDYCEK